MYSLDLQPVISRTVLEKNPFRYRGYYYDEETGYYYLNSRYYDPELKRFINADSALEAVLTNGCVNFMQYNLYAYCNDNPVNKTDDLGCLAVANLGLFGEMIEKSYVEWTGLTKEEHLGRNKLNKWGEDVTEIYTYDELGVKHINDGWTEVVVCDVPELLSNGKKIAILLMIK